MKIFHPFPVSFSSTFYNFAWILMDSKTLYGKNVQWICVDTARLVILHFLFNIF